MGDADFADFEAAQAEWDLVTQTQVSLLLHDQLIKFQHLKLVKEVAFEPKSSTDSIQIILRAVETKIPVNRKDASPKLLVRKQEESCISLIKR